MAKAASAADLKLKIGKRVVVKGGNGFPEGGKITGIEQTASGEFVEVNFGDKRNPHVMRYRPSRLELMA